MPALEQRLELRSEDTILHFAEGLIGFSEFKDFALMQHENLAPFRLLQSLESPDVAFLVLEAAAFIRNYDELVPQRAWETVGVAGLGRRVAFVIVAIGSNPQSSTANAQAPLLVNYDTKIGKQVILTDCGLPVRQPLCG
jgi:flagellar assembly factor FliW